MRKHRRQKDLLRSLISDRRGTTAVVIGIGMVALVGFAGLGSEAALWYVTKRTMHGAADSAAFSAAVAATAGDSYTTEAKSTAAKYGFVDQQNNVTVAVHKPPLSGNYTSKSSAIEVVIQQPQPRLFSALFLGSNPTIASRAVALPGSDNDCVLALNTTISNSISNSGTTSVNLVKCGIGDNSSDPSALSLSGNATVSADSVSVVGGISQSNGATLSVVNSTITGGGTIADPYAGVTIPPYSGCNVTGSGPIHGSVSYDAGGGIFVFCGDVKLNSSASNPTLTLSNGIFIIDGGSLTVQSGTTLNLVNATLILTSSTGKNFGTISISSSATVNATAPTSGPTSGLAFYVDRNAPAATDKFNGGSTQSITGAIYAPSQTISYTGGATATGTGCTQIIGDQVQFTGNSTVESNCAGKGTKSVALPPKLVE